MSERFVWGIDFDDAVQRIDQGDWYADEKALLRDVMRTRREGDRPLRIAMEEVEDAPQWWWWYCGDRKWGDIPAHRDKVGVQLADSLSGVSLSVYGTIADRDAKRDALLAAAKAAGKEPQP